MRDQPTIGGRPKAGKKPDDDASTQISGGASPHDPSPKTMPSASPPAFGPFDRAAPRFGQQPAAPPPAAESAEETVFMEMEANARVPLAWLAVVSGPGAKRGKVITLGAETVVGRTQGNLLLAGDRGVSSQHLRIRLEPRPEAAGELVFVAYDQATTNGTYIGPWETYREESARVYRRELKDGDFLLLSETTLVFKQIDQ